MVGERELADDERRPRSKEEGNLHDQKIEIENLGHLFRALRLVMRAACERRTQHGAVSTRTAEEKVEGVQGAWWMPVASRAEEGRG